MPIRACSVAAGALKAQGASWGRRRPGCPVEAQWYAWRRRVCPRGRSRACARDHIVGEAHREDPRRPRQQWFQGPGTRNNKWKTSIETAADK